MTTPENVNQLYSDKFKFVLVDNPHVEYFCKTAAVPGININPIEIPTPINPLHVGGNQLRFDDLTIEFKVDEDLKNYTEIFEWMKGISAPTKFKEHADYVNRQSKFAGPKNYGNIFKDATLISLTNTMNKNILVLFKNIFPIGLSGIDFAVESKEITLRSTVTFKIESYDIEFK